MDNSTFSIGHFVLTDHMVTCYLPVEGVDHELGPVTCLSNLANTTNGVKLAQCPIPQDQYNGLISRYADTPVWEPLPQPAAVSKDLYPQIQRLVDGSNKSLCARWRLSNHAQRFLKSANLYDSAVKPEYRYKKSLEVLLSSSSVRRIEQHGVVSKRLRMSIDSLELITFRTGLGFVVVRLSFGQKKDVLTAIELIELVYNLSRNSSVRWINSKSGDPCSEMFSLKKLVNRFTQSDVVVENNTRRISTLSYARLKDSTSLSDRQHLGMLLARHYSTDYQLRESKISHEVIKEFTNVLHTICLEASAVIVGPSTDDDDLPTYLRNFGSNSVIPVYSNIALLALHERLFLLAKALISGSTRDSEPDESQLRRLTQSTLMFRLCFRYTQISEITMHNAVNSVYRDVYALDQMQNELHDDVVSIEALMRETREIEHENHSSELYKKFYWVGSIGSSALAGLSGYTIVKEVTGITAKADPSAPVSAGGLSYNGPLSLLVGVLVAVIALWITYLKKPAKARDIETANLGKTVMIQTMLRAARR